MIQKVALSSAGTYTCYEAASSSAVSTINLVVLAKLRWVSWRQMVYLVLGYANAYVDASGAIGPAAITYTWSVNGQQINKSNAQAGTPFAIS